MTGIAGYLFGSSWHINWEVFLALIFGMGLIIASACVTNNYLDQGIDSKMKRTQERALVLGHISQKHAVLLASTLGVIGFVAISQTNLITVVIGVSAFISYVFVYGYAKRRSVYGTLVGTVPGCSSIVAGFSAATGHLNVDALLLFLIMASWQMAHFYAIAIYRLEDYQAASIPVWPAVKGIVSTRRQIKFFILLFAVFNVVLGLFYIKSYVYTIVLLGASCCWLKLGYKSVKPRQEPVWAKQVFLFSLVTTMVFSVFLALAGLVKL
jgi:protoheme IX farnesyltransferase